MTIIAIIGFEEDDTIQRIVHEKYESGINSVMNSLRNSTEGPFTPVIKATFEIVEGGCIVDLFRAFCYLRDDLLPGYGLTPLKNDWFKGTDRQVIAATHGFLQVLAGTIDDGSLRRKNGDDNA